MTRLRQKGERVRDQARINLANHSFSGNLAQNIDVVIEADRGSRRTVVKVIAREPYARYVETGTGPGHRPDARSNYYPPPTKPEFAAWALAHGNNPYALANSIFTKGTPATFFMTNAFKSVFK